MAENGGVAQLQQFFNENFVYKQNEIIDSSVSIDDINSTKYLDGIYHCLGWTNGAPNGTSGNGILTKTSMGADTMIEFTDTVNHARYWTSTVWGAFRGGWNQY